MAKAKAAKRVVKSVAKSGITFDASEIQFCCGLTEIGQFEIHEGHYETKNGGEYESREEAEVESIDDAKHAVECIGEKWTAGARALAVAEVTAVDGQDYSVDVPVGATFATTNSTDQKNVEEKLPKLGFKVVAAWKNGGRDTIKLWFKKPDGQKTVRI